ncbi:hypothetical protein CW304_17185 [Bacillus sp. UFRGS-B20]|nr:hypothetical protein CW304_17185 [Bacillus sp. UFRGS-B20]
MPLLKTQVIRVFQTKWTINVPRKTCLQRGLPRFKLSGPVVGYSKLLPSQVTIPSFTIYIPATEPVQFNAVCRTNYFIMLPRFLSHFPHSHLHYVSCV